MRSTAATRRAKRSAAPETVTRPKPGIHAFAKLKIKIPAADDMWDYYTLYSDADDEGEQLWELSLESPGDDVPGANGEILSDTVFVNSFERATISPRRNQVVGIAPPDDRSTTYVPSPSVQLSSLPAVSSAASIADGSIYKSASWTFIENGSSPTALEEEDWPPMQLTPGKCLDGEHATSDTDDWGEWTAI